MNSSESKNLDEIDLEILKILSKDGRETYHAISQLLRDKQKISARSPVTIKKHVTDLEEKGIIKSYGVTIDYEKLGFNIIAVIELTVSKGKMIEVEEKIGKNPHVFAVYDITGTYDALILARFKNRADLSIMIKEIHKYPEVERTNTHLILNVIKEGSPLDELM